MPSDHAAPIVLKPKEMRRYQRGGGASTIPLVSARIGATGFINGITEFGPSALVPFHSHNCEESVILLEGDAVMEMPDGEQHILAPFDTTWVPANLVHRFRNLSADQPMKIFWTYASLDATRTVVGGETRPVAAEYK